MSDLGELLERLRGAHDPRERNALAIVATATRSPSVLPVLIELIDRPDLLDQRATLVNCMGEFDCSRHFLWLVNLVAQGNWEVAHEAYDILSCIDVIDSKEVKRGYNVLSKRCAAGDDDGWRIQLMRDLLKMFD